MSKVKGVVWEEYADEHPHFIDEDMISQLLEKLLRRLNERNKPFSIIDLGCGDGESYMFYTVRGCSRMLIG